MLTTDQIARVAHEANRAYCEAIGDHSQVSWDEAPDWQKTSARAGVHLHARDPEAGAKASHEAWVKQKIGDGWVLGAEKCSVQKTHPCLVPFDQLPVEQQLKDYLFMGVVHALLALEE